MSSTAAKDGYAGYPQLSVPRGRDFSGGDLLAQTLVHLGVSVAFGLHGGHLDAFLMGAHDSGIRLIDTRHETVAVQAAEGYAKVKGQVGVCFFTANSGFGNALAGISTAMADRSPIFCITSSAPQRDAEMNVLQGFHDQIVVSKPVTRFCHRCVHAEEIPRLVSHAFHMATASPPGPTLIDFPIDVLFSPVEPKRISWGSIRMKPSYQAGPHPEAIEKAVQMFSASRRPVIITGAGARGLEEDSCFHDFVAKAQIPTFHSNEYSGALPNKHPLRGGVANLLSGLKVINHPAPDLVLLLAARTGFFLGSRGSPCIPHPDVCQYIQVDVDSGEIGRAHEIHLGITSDAKPAMDALASGLASVHYTAPADWVKTTMGLKAGPMPQEEDAEEYEPGRVHPYHALKRAFSSLPEDATLSIGKFCLADSCQKPHRLVPYLGKANTWTPNRGPTFVPIYAGLEREPKHLSPCLCSHHCTHQVSLSTYSACI